MARITVASIAGLVGFCLYLMVAVAWADHLDGYHWSLRVLYFAFAGVLWVIPVRWLMLWAARGRRPTP